MSRRWMTDIRADALPASRPFLAAIVPSFRLRNVEQSFGPAE